MFDRCGIKEQEARFGSEPELGHPFKRFCSVAQELQGIPPQLRNRPQKRPGLRSGNHWAGTLLDSCRDFSTESGRAGGRIAESTLLYKEWRIFSDENFEKFVRSAPLFCYRYYFRLTLNTPGQAKLDLNSEVSLRHKLKCYVFLF
jgi:hypothetical protein